MCLDQAVFAAATKTSEGLAKQSFSETPRRVFGLLFTISDHGHPDWGRDAQICRFATPPKANVRAPIARPCGQPGLTLAPVRNHYGIVSKTLCFEYF